MIKLTINHANGIRASPIIIYPRDFMAVPISSVLPGAHRSFAPTQMIYITAITPTNINIHFCISEAMEV